MDPIKGSITRDCLSKMCRVCVENKPDSLSLAEDIIISDKLQCTLLYMFNNLTNMEYQDDRLPQLICIECVKLLEAAYTFKLKYKESLIILEKYLENIKEESDVDDDQLNEAQSKAVTVVSTKKTSNRGARRRATPPGRRKVKRESVDESECVPECSEDREDSEEAEQALLHPCPICTQEFPALELRRHVRTHKALRNYLTVPASKKLHRKARFVASRDMTNVVSLFDMPGDKHKCPYCDKMFNTEKFHLHAELHRHQDEYKCEQCGRVFRKLNHLNTHRVKHLKEYPFKCEQCGKGFVIKTNYDCHVLTHTNAELPHECHYCLRRFSNPEHLRRHLIGHTENVTYSVKHKVCKCYQCLKTFKDKEEMQRHLCTPVEQISSGLFSCKKCKKVFKHSSGLYNHVRNIHKHKGTKTLCSVCGHHVSNIYNHMMRHTGQKSYACDQCDKSFFTRPQLKQHLLVHSGLKPYVCSVCAKAFNNLYNLQVHERIHKGDRCHVCIICNKSFLEKSYLKKHMYVHKK